MTFFSRREAVFNRFKVCLTISYTITALFVALQLLRFFPLFCFTPSRTYVSFSLSPLFRQRQAIQFLAARVVHYVCALIIRDFKSKANLEKFSKKNFIQFWLTVKSYIPWLIFQQFLKENKVDAPVSVWELDILFLFSFLHASTYSLSEVKMTATSISLQRDGF